jgi:hypothetical protein
MVAFTIQHSIILLSIISKKRTKMMKEPWEAPMSYCGGGTSAYYSIYTWIDANAHDDFL